ncbi:MAG: hypothetical protein AAGJ28_04475 [Pseudomonadota bacterium]
MFKPSTSQPELTQAIIDQYVAKGRRERSAALKEFFVALFGIRKETAGLPAPQAAASC